MKIKNLLIIITLFLATVSCTLRPNVKKSGINNLSIIQEKFIINTSNKNDVLNELGESILKNYPDNNVWIYIETESKNELFGQKELLKNDVLVISFNSKGILIKKNLYTKDDMMKVTFNEEFTKTYSINHNLSKKFFTGMKKRLDTIEKSDQK